MNSASQTTKHKWKLHCEILSLKANFNANNYIDDPLFFCFVHVIKHQNHACNTEMEEEKAQKTELMIAYYDEMSSCKAAT